MKEIEKFEPIKTSDSVKSAAWLFTKAMYQVFLKQGKSSKESAQQACQLVASLCKKCLEK